MLENRRGVSEVISALILLFIVSATGIALYAISNSMTGSQTTEVLGYTEREMEEVREQFEIVKIKSEADSWNLTVFNYGLTDITISRVYTNGEESASPDLPKPIYSSTIGFINIGTAEINFNADVQVINLVSERGVTYEYEYKEE
ncbi:MAG: hypothetical protein ACOC6G_00560 [Thermoproteota archaeon]